MLDLVPLARSRAEAPTSRVGLEGRCSLRQFAAKTGLTLTVCHFPAVGGDEERAGSGVCRVSHLLPPATDRVHGKGRRVVIDPHADQAGVTGQVVHPDRDAQFRYINV